MPSGRPADSRSGEETLPGWVPAVVTVLLFAVWSNSFVAVSYLLGTEEVDAQFNWVSLTVARFVVAGPLCALFCLLVQPRESARLLRLHWRRLLICGFLAVPVYNFGLYFAQQHGVTPPIASLTTTLVPLLVMVLSVLFLGERLTGRRVVGLLVAAAGMSVVATARGDVELGYPILLAIATLAPLSWSIYTVASKPVVGKVSPVLWTYLTTAVGSVMVLPWLPGRTWKDLGALSSGGWVALLYLAVPCAVIGFAVWTWLLRHLPATAVGFTVF